MSNIGSSVYNGAIELERGKTLIGAICGTLIGLCLCVLGGFIFVKKTSTSEATVSANVCTVVQGATTCKITISYLVNGTSYTTTLISPTSHDVGTKFSIVYDPSNPQRVSIPNSMSNSMAGLGMMGCAVCLVVIGWGWWYVTNKYESVAAVQAVGDTLSILRRN